MYKASLKKLNFVLLFKGPHSWGRVSIILYVLIQKHILIIWWLSIALGNQIHQKLWELKHTSLVGVVMQYLTGRGWIEETDTVSFKLFRRQKVSSFQWIRCGVFKGTRTLTIENVLHNWSMPLSHYYSPLPFAMPILQRRRGIPNDSNCGYKSWGPDDSSVSKEFS